MRTTTRKQRRGAGWAAAAWFLLLAGCSGSAQLNAKASVGDSADADHDGVRDDADKCPTEMEDGLPPDPKDGCKSNDPDGDGIVGAADRCPFVAETRNGVDDTDGCPDAKVTVTRQPRVTVTKTELKIDEKILFAFGQATIDKASDDLIKEIADVIKKNPQIEAIEVAGHADRKGNDTVNVSLTKRRAAAVADALAELGVERKRLRAQGYGRYCPLDPGDSDDASEKNRRVEFKILRVSGRDTGVQVGCQAAVAKGIKSGK